MKRALTKEVTAILKKNKDRWYSVNELSAILSKEHYKGDNVMLLRDLIRSALNKLRTRRPNWLEWRHFPKSWEFRCVKKVQQQACDTCGDTESKLTGMVIQGKPYLFCRDCLCADYKKPTAEISNPSALGWNT